MVPLVPAHRWRPGRRWCLRPAHPSAPPRLGLEQGRGREAGSDSAYRSCRPPGRRCAASDAHRRRPATGVAAARTARRAGQGSGPKKTTASKVGGPMLRTCGLGGDGGLLLAYEAHGARLTMVWSDDCSAKLKAQGLGGERPCGGRMAPSLSTAQNPAHNHSGASGPSDQAVPGTGRADRQRAGCSTSQASKCCGAGSTPPGSETCGLSDAR